MKRKKTKKFVLRIDEETFNLIKKKSDDNDVSINTEIVKRLKKSITKN